METFTVNLSYSYNSKPHEVFSKIEDGTLFDLTGADEITFIFGESEAFSMLFKNRGEIFGTITKIIPDEKVLINWSVTGFGKPDERNTKLELSIEETEDGKSMLNVLNTEIKNKDAYEAKKIAWTEILEDLEKAMGEN